MPDHSTKYLHVTARGSLDKDGRLEYIGAAQDVTQRRLSEEALSKARSELAHVARVASLGVLTASIAHEVNQPLSGIITDASTCLRMLAAEPPNVEGERNRAACDSRWQPCGRSDRETRTLSNGRMAALVEVWNGIPGLAPAKKLKDRKAAVGKIWAAIQGLDGGAAETPKHTQTAATAARKTATKAKHAAKPKPTKAAKAPRPSPPRPPRRAGKTAGKAAPRVPSAASARDGSKKATVLALLQRKNGATLAEIMKATRLAGAFGARIHSRGAGQEHGPDGQLRQAPGRRKRVYSIG